MGQPEILPKQFCGGSVLVVDDEKIIVRRLTVLLERLGYHVLGFHDRAQALDIIGKQHFDIIITDLKMRKFDGLTIIKAAKKRAKEACVIVITGHCNIHSASEALNNGAAECIAKPFRLDELKRAIAKATGEMLLSQNHTQRNM